MKKTLALLSALALTVGLLSGCGPQEAKTPAPETKPAATEPAGKEPAGENETTFGIAPMDKETTVRIGFFAGAEHSCPFYVMEQEGWLDELNIKFEYNSFSAGPAMMEANASWDMATSGSAGCINGMIGYDLKTIGIAQYEGIIDIYVREDSPIYQSGAGHVSDVPEIYGTADDWKGTTWLLPAGTTAQKVLASTLERFGLTTDDVTMVNMDVASALAAFKAGEGDGVVLWTGTALAASEAGFKKVGGCDWNGDVFSIGLLATDDAIANKSEVVEKIFQLYYKTLEYLMANRDEFARYMKECYDVEGLACTESMAKELADRFVGFELDYMLDYMTSEFEDPMGLAGRKLNGGEKDMFETLDYFISLGNYKPEDRAFILDNDKITNTVAQSVLAQR